MLFEYVDEDSELITDSYWTYRVDIKKYYYFPITIMLVIGDDTTKYIISIPIIVRVQIRKTNFPFRMALQYYNVLDTLLSLWLERDEVSRKIKYCPLNTSQSGSKGRARERFML